MSKNIVTLDESPLLVCAIIFLLTIVFFQTRYRFPRQGV
ncbi:hypothetical protein ASZ90_018514 [hydrocarbon metagenome]|uniref:Uncharacterized protein n=1 Tax=hydrocarbon metagenome TaxID=938273 RepID=A0A0W8E605_9ZZZZ